MFKEFEVVEVISCFFFFWLVFNGGGDYFLVEIERIGSIKFVRLLDYELIKFYLIIVVLIDGGGFKVGGVSNWV